jgi:polar amino acid transport system permease protein
MASDNRKTLKTKTYYLWVGLFFVLLTGLIGFLYYSTAKIDYVWRWHRVPRYFVYENNVEIKSEIEGTVHKISIKNGKAVILIKNEATGESYDIYPENIMVSQGDYVYMGDVLSTHKQWETGLLLKGLWLTLKVSVIAIILGTILGLFGGIARVSSNPALKWASATYVETIRGSPLLVQIFIWYFVLGTLINNILAQYSINPLPPLWYGIASLACFAGAYVAEIVRAGIQSIHRGQSEAARSLGMTYSQAMRHVILPQAILRILPPLAGQFISLIKDSSLLGIIAIRELTKATREAVTSSLQPFELWFSCAILYLVLTFSLSLIVQYMERRMLVND